MLRRNAFTLKANSSSQWMQGQAADPFVLEARRKGYVARSACKLSYMNERYHLFDKYKTKAVIDLGCSPGGWCQVIRENTNSKCVIIGLDLLPAKAIITNAVFLQGDFTAADTQRKLLMELERAQTLSSSSGGTVDPTSAPGKVDVVTSDMCPNRGGGAQDRQRIAALQLSALQFSVPLLREGGHFVCKVLGSKKSFEEVYRLSERYFLKTYICKPPASRAHSDECFLLATEKLKVPREVQLNTASSRAAVSYGLDDWPGSARRPRRHRGRG